MAKAQLYKIIGNLPLTGAEKNFAKKVLEELDEQAGILYVKELQDKHKTEKVL